MKNKFSLLLLAFMLVGSGSAFADTITDEMSDDTEMPQLSLEMSADELQEITEICTSIADDSGLVSAEHTQYVDECIATETMVTSDPEMPLENMDTMDMDNLDDAPLESDEMSGDYEVMPEQTDS